jgi:hypothetical protein
MRAKRDYAMLGMLFGRGFRRSKLVGLSQARSRSARVTGAAVDLIGKGGHVRTVPIPEWVKAVLDQCTRAAGESAMVEGSAPVEIGFSEGIECRHRESEHEQPICDPKRVSLPERAELVEIGKSHRPHSFRRCSEAGTSGCHAQNKTDGGPDQGTCGRLGVGNIT